jgi:hypothetical protein
MRHAFQALAVILGASLLLAVPAHAQKQPSASSSC